MEALEASNLRQQVLQLCGRIQQIAAAAIATGDSKTIKSLMDAYEGVGIDLEPLEECLGIEIAPNLKEADGLR